MEKSTRQFRGFTSEALTFLYDIKANNSKDWYEENKANYRRYLLHPFQDLVFDLTASIKAIDPEIVTMPTVDKTISRIYRDTRFSRDKSRYRDAMWLVFKRSSREWTQMPAFYFEMTPGWYRYGMGFYSALPRTMACFRQVIDERPSAFLTAISFYDHASPFILEGECYKRILKPGQPATIKEWYQKKNFHLTCRKPVDERLFSPELTDDLIGGFAMLAPLYRYLWQICEAQSPN
ncbi:MAG: DUF2461 domain-containing protein [Syntrophales bacterium]|nr:DUF2461 domain-containing protein [Syntrophales bacterium]